LWAVAVQQLLLLLLLLRCHVAEYRHGCLSVTIFLLLSQHEFDSGGDVAAGMICSR
jgi:hypothetical protein